VSRYQRRISGPLLDRIDLFVDVPRVAYEKLASAVRGEPSAAVAERVERARTVQHARFVAAGDSPVRLNAEMTSAQVREFAQQRLGEGAGDVLRMAVQRLNLSARAFHRVLKLSRTIADLAESEIIESAHVAESIQYRQRLE
jgi:magnesium chelatase family protein